MELKRSSHYDGFESNFERDIESVYRLISSLMKSLSNFGKLAIKHKIGLRLFLCYTSGTQNIWCIAHSVYCRV